MAILRSLFLCLLLVLVFARPVFSSDSDVDRKAKYLNDQGLQLAQGGEDQRAIKAYNAAIQLNPSLAATYLYRAQIFAETGDFPSALRDCNRYLQLDSSSPAGYLTRGFVLLRMGRDAESRADLSAAIAKGATTTDLTGAQAMLSLLRATTPDGARTELGRLNEKVAHARAGSAKASALNSRAWLEATSAIEAIRDGRKAVADAVEACRLRHSDDSDYLDTIAAAYAETGDFENALRFEKKAIAILPRKKANYLSVYRAHLAAYKGERPWRANALDRVTVRYKIER